MVPSARCATWFNWVYDEYWYVGCWLYLFWNGRWAATISRTRAKRSTWSHLQSARNAKRNKLAGHSQWAVARIKKLHRKIGQAKNIHWWLVGDQSTAARSQWTWFTFESVKIFELCASERARRHATSNIWASWSQCTLSGGYGVAIHHTPHSTHPATGKKQSQRVNQSPTEPHILRHISSDF